ncbi:integrator complex subunit 3 [Panicum hallii]|nr:integrator complex subunit 3 [Panicum hallii]
MAPIQTSGNLSSSPMPPPPSSSPPPRLLAGGEHLPPPTSASSPEHPFLSAHLLLPSPSPSPADLSSPHLPHALAFAFLTQPSPLPRHLLVVLHAAGARFTAFYQAFASALLSLPFPLLLPHPRARLLLAASELARAAAPGFGSLLASLLRRVPFPGDARLLELFTEHASFLADEEPQLLASAVFAFLRLLARNRLAPAPSSAVCKDCEECKSAKSLEECRGKLVSFCVSMLRDHFQVCALIGRDLVRSLHELALVPEFQPLWRDLMPDRVGDVCLMSTPGWCTALAITAEMETQLLFMMNNVKWGDQKRYQLWFVRKHLMMPGGEERIPDIVRFICCGYHPTNEVMHSGVIARWAVIGWLLTFCRKGYVVANAKLALFYDWLFFEEGRGSIMNIEPAMLLMVNSVSQYTDITNMLLEFLFLLIDNYDVRRKHAIACCVRSAFEVLVKKRVISSLEQLTCCEKLSPLLRQKLVAFLSSSNPGAAEDSCGKPTPIVSKETELKKSVCSS